MPESTDMCLRSTRSSIVRSARVLSARRPSSAIPRLAELKLCLDNNNNNNNNDDGIEALHRVSIDDSLQTTSVYVRLKPCLTKLKRIKKLQDEAYVVENPSTLVTKFPTLDGSANCQKKFKNPEATSRKLMFTRVFAADTSQSEFFDQAIKERVAEFLAGQSCTLMTYGTTNSGKSYTLHGNGESPGIVPRSIEFLFSGVDCTLAPWYKPQNLREVQSLSEAERRNETKLRETFLTSKSIDRYCCEAAYRSLANSMKEDRESTVNGDAMHSVWLSFAEIYNENVYDLLADDESEVKLAPLRLVKDKQGRAYVQGLRTMCATTGLQAYQIFIAGQAKLTVSGSNVVNPRSSRSHSIFTIKLLKYVKEHVSDQVEVTTMTFCDLVGTGRSKKSTGSSNELKETKNINTSLLVLGRCLKGIVDCQTSKQNVEVGGAFRESKLTRILQRALSGKENLTLVVNVDTSPDIYVETQGVLNFATIAKKIVINPERDSKRFCGSEFIIASPKAAEIFSQWEKPISQIDPIEIPIDLKDVNTTGLEECEQSNIYLKKEIEVLRESALNREDEIRQEMADLYAGMIKDLEANWRKQSEDVVTEKEDYQKWSVTQVETFCKERIDSLTNRKRRRISGGDERDDGQVLFEELEIENSQITKKVIYLQETVKTLKEELETMGADKNKCVFELGLARDELRRVRELIDAERGENVVIKENSVLVDELRTFIDDKNASIKNLQKRFFSTVGKTFQSSELSANSGADDSGFAMSERISLSTDNSLQEKTEEKGSQTGFENDDFSNDVNNQVVQERVEKLKLDYTKLKAEHFDETIRVTELSQELECIQYALGELKEMTLKNEQKIIEYQDELALREKDLSNVGKVKNEMQTKLTEMRNELEKSSATYEKKISELSGKLKIREESENRTSKCLEEYLEKSASLESQLSAAHAQLDRTSIKCFTVHEPKIEKLERQLLAKTVQVNELDAKLSENQRDFTRVEKLNEKVQDFEIIFEKYQSERAELGRQLRERSETQSTLECILKKLTTKMHERESEISTLRTDLGNVVEMNMENSERAKELSREIVEALGKLANAKAEMTRSEDERRKLDRTSGHEIGNLIARLADFEKNAALLSRMRDTENSRTNELDRLKLLLHEKEREMFLFKKNRDKTMRRYEALIRKLQADVEMRCNRESSKLRMIYPKSVISKESLRSVAGSLRWKNALHQDLGKIKSSQVAIGERIASRWKAPSRYSCAHLRPSCSRVIKRSSSHALVTSSTSLEGSRSSGSKQFPLLDDDDEDEECAAHEIIETESRSELNVDVIECRRCGSRREALSQAAATFSIPSTSDDSFTDLRNIPEWMEIRRTNGKTHFPLRKGDSSESKPRM